MNPLCKWHFLRFATKLFNSSKYEYEYKKSTKMKEMEEKKDQKVM